MSLLVASRAFARATLQRHSQKARVCKRNMSSSSRDSAQVPPLMTAKRLSEELKSGSNVVVLDTSWFMKSAGMDVKVHFDGNRVPGAQLFEIDEVCDKKSKLPHMLPTEAEFAAAVSRMGIGNDTHVVCYDSNPHFSASARVWWMFRYFGHDKVSLVDGGLDSWIIAGLPTENAAPKSAPKEADFKVLNVRKHLLKELAQIKENIKSEKFLVIDARSAERFRGVEAEPRPGLASGHIPGSINIPFRRVIDGFGSFNSEPKMRQLLAELELDLDQPITTTCGSGVTAAIVAFSFHLLGKSDVAIYDGSWAEYGQKSLDLKVDTGLY